MLVSVGEEFNYGLDLCYMSQGAHIKHLYIDKKKIKKFHTNPCRAIVCVLHMFVILNCWGCPFIL
jgi:hypothetical protein